MNYNDATRFTFAPRLPVVDLPAVSPRPASCRPPSSRPWWAFGSNKNGRETQAATHRTDPVPLSMPTVGYLPRNSHDGTTSAWQTHPDRPGYVPYTPSLQHDLSKRMPISSMQGGGYTPDRQAHTQRIAPRSMTPSASSAGSSRTRGFSLSSNRSEVPMQRTTVPEPIPARHESRKSSLSSKSTITMHRSKPLKEESISLSWPLVKFSSSTQRRRKPLLYFDVGFDPRQLKNLLCKVSVPGTGAYEPLPSVDCALSASTHCEMKSMMIECPQIGRITVERAGGICVLDIFSDIYDAYRLRLRSDEQPRDFDGRYLEAFRQRCRDSPHPDAEMRAGMRRVDLLRGKRIFEGLTREGADWKLELHRPVAF